MASVEHGSTVNLTAINADRFVVADGVYHTVVGDCVWVICDCVVINCFSKGHCRSGHLWTWLWAVTSEEMLWSVAIAPTKAAIAYYRVWKVTTTNDGINLSSPNEFVRVLEVELILDCWCSARNWTLVRCWINIEGGNGTRTATRTTTLHDSLRLCHFSKMTSSPRLFSRRCDMHTFGTALLNRASKFYHRKLELGRCKSQWREQCNDYA